MVLDSAITKLITGHSLGKNNLSKVKVVTEMVADFDFSGLQQLQATDRLEEVIFTQ